MTKKYGVPRSTGTKWVKNKDKLLASPIEKSIVEMLKMQTKHSTAGLLENEARK